jgi:peptidoglycan/xylan/chitin deacetylase (PgdA/CDA1 family)
MELMSWPDLSFLADQGWEIGGHTVSHARLPGVSAAVMQEEIAEGRRILQDRTGCAVASFAYPYGELGAGCTEAVAAAGFTSGWTMDPVINRPPCDPLTLGRFNCDRIQSEDPEAAELAVRTYASGRYGAYAILTARRLRIRRRPQRTR